MNDNDISAWRQKLQKQVEDDNTPPQPVQPVRLLAYGGRPIRDDEWLPRDKWYVRLWKTIKRMTGLNK